MKSTIRWIPGSNLRGQAVSFGIACALVAGLAHAGWELTPSVTLGTIYSDNVTLAPKGAETSDLILELAPALDARFEGRRLDADIRYRARSLFYRDRDDLDQTYHFLDARTNAELVQDTFFLDAGVGVRQQVIDPSVVIPGETLSGGENLSDEYTAFISPHWTGRVADNLQADVRYVLGAVRYDEGTLTDSDQHVLAALLERTPEAGTLYWALRYRQARVEFEDEDNVTLEQGTGELGIPVTGRTRLILIGGYERNNFLLADGSNAPDDSLWAVGLRSSRGERFEVEVLAGERVFGNTFSLRWVQRAPRWRMVALYDEDFVTYAETRLSIDPRSPESILPGPDLGRAASDVYLRERAQVDLAFDWRRTTASMRVYNERRDYQTREGEEEVRGVDFSIDWLFRPRTSFVLAAGVEETDILGADAEDRLTRLSAGVTQQLGRRTAGSLSLARSDRSSDLAEREYTENAIIARLIATF